MNIENHLKLLLKKYNLNLLFNKFLFISLISACVRELFYLALIFFSKIVQHKPEIINLLTIILVGLLFINIPIEKQLNQVKSDFMKQIKLANTTYFNIRLTKISKNKVLNIDLVEFYSILDSFNINLELYILNLRNKNNIPIRFITLCILALYRRFEILIVVFILFYVIVKNLNENKIIIEKELIINNNNIKKSLRNYIINSKNLIINNEFNNKFVFDKNNKLELINKNIEKLKNKLDINIRIIMYFFIIIVIIVRYKKLNQFDFLYYFLIVYDIEYIATQINEYYDTKIIYNKMDQELDYLNSFIPITKNIKKTTIKTIIINKIYNKNPQLYCNKPILIQTNDHILVNGISGSGKSSFFYLLKGMINIEELQIKPSIDIISSQTYITLTNHKDLFNGNLYDIISNYESDPDIDLIIYSLKTINICKLFEDNEYINIEEISSGERIRIIIARIIYSVKKNNYNILLLDEIDQNLNDDLVYNIYINLKEIFKDKIVFYITQNDKVKTLFNKTISINNGIIKFYNKN